LALEGAPGASIEIPAHELADADPVALVTRLENRLRRLEERQASALDDAERARREIEHATTSLGKAFPQSDEVAAARERVRQIDAELERMAQAKQEPANAAAEDAPPQPDGSPRPERPPLPGPASSSPATQAAGHASRQCQGTAALARINARESWQRERRGQPEGRDPAAEPEAGQ